MRCEGKRFLKKMFIRLFWNGPDIHREDTEKRLKFFIGHSDPSPERRGIGEMK